MPNNYFQFKQFIIFQDKCAMKLCTDACLFGAWVARTFEHTTLHNILDIGTGTGLLPLMLAQKINASIETIEIEPEAYLQSTENISMSPWKERIRTIQGDARTVHLNNKYDLIISNPPFYENNLRSPDGSTNMARHEESLTITSLLSIVAAYLTTDGYFAVLVPFHRTGLLLANAAEVNLYPSTIMQVKHSPVHNFFRTMVIFSRMSSTITSREWMSIKENSEYTAEFRQLLKDYYLKL